MSGDERIDALLAGERLVHFEFDGHGVVTEHQGSVGLLGAPREAVGRSVLDDYPQLPWLATHARRALAGETVREVVDVAGAALRLRYLPLQGDGGRVSLVIVLGSDITDQRRREQALAESEDRWRSLAEATFEAIGIHERGRILAANARMGEMFGYAAAELIGMNAVDLAAPESRAEVARRIAENDERAYEGVGLRRDGSRFLAELRSRLSVYQGRPVRITAIQDVTARRRAEDERARLLAAEQAARAQAEAALHIRDEFMSIAAHELNSPLTTLKLRIDQLAELVREPSPSTDVARAAELTARAAELTEICRRQTHKLSHLVRDLLDVTRIRAGQLTIDRVEVDLVELVREVVARLHEELARAHASVEVTAPATLVGRWDRLRLDQVLVNLLSNAIKFGAGKPITVAVEAIDGAARLQVRDRGVGVAPELQAKIFDRFERSSPGKALGGLGLGLYIVKQIVVAHGGSVAVASAPGAGATFTVELPR